MSAAHTPGKWKALIEDDEIRVVLDDNLPGYAEIARIERQKEEVANAHLVASAPDLLASCKELREALAALMRVCFVSDCDHSKAWGAELARLGITDGVGVRAQQAIRKAEGR